MRAILMSLLLASGVVALVGCGKRQEPLDLERMPRCLGPWEGTDTPLDPMIRATLGADVVLDRLYRHSEDQTAKVSAHLAAFSDWDRGIGHDPMVVYRSCGCKLIEQTYETLYIGSEKNIRANLSEWKQGRRSLVVLFWYQIGDHVLFKRSELDRLRSGLNAQQPRPLLIKIQLQTDLAGGTNVEQGKATLKQLATAIRRWLDKPYYDPPPLPPAAETPVMALSE
jgi:EpsI family protein